MKTATLLGFFLMIVGAIALAYQGITYTTHKTVLDVGPIEATKTEHKTIPLPPIVGGLALLGGIVLVAAGRREA